MEQTQSSWNEPKIPLVSQASANLRNSELEGDFKVIFSNSSLQLEISPKKL
jgi:hypothetical protein